MTDRPKVEDNLGLIWHVIKKLPKTVISDLGGDEDAFQTGAVALIRAAALFDMERGVKFSTYAWWAIHMELCKSAVNTALVRMRREKGVYNFSKKPIIHSLNEALSAGDSNFTREMMLIDHRPQEDPFAGEHIYAALSRLDDRERFIFESLVEKKSNRRKLAQHFGVSINTVDRAYKAARKQLQEDLCPVKKE